MSQLILATQEKNIQDKLSSFKNSLSKETSFVMDSVIQRKPHAETPNCGYVHPIPYCLVTYKGKVLFYQRTSMSGETRLQGQFSLGIGGHVDLDNEEELNSKSADEFIKETALREFEEELLIEASLENVEYFKVLGTLYDTTTEVNRLHLGYICQIELTDIGYQKVTEPDHIFEDHIDNVSFFDETHINTEQYMLDLFDKFESWSQIILTDMENKVVIF